MKGGGTSMAQRVHGGGMAFLGENDTCLQCPRRPARPVRFSSMKQCVKAAPFVIRHTARSISDYLTERNQTLCLKCHFQQQTVSNSILIGNVDHHVFPASAGPAGQLGAMRNRTVRM
jgi:hypothetical protein